MSEIIVPLSPGILCAEGLIVSDLKESFVKTVRLKLVPSSRDDIAGAVHDHGLAVRVLGAAPGAGPLGVAVVVELDEVGVVPSRAGRLVVVLGAGVEVQVDGLLEPTGDVDVACGVEVDVVAEAAGTIAGVAALPLWCTDPLAGSVGGELGHEGHVVVAGHAGPNSDRTDRRRRPEVPDGEDVAGRIHLAPPD